MQRILVWLWVNWFNLTMPAMIGVGMAGIAVNTLTSAHHSKVATTIAALILTAALLLSALKHAEQPKVDKGK